MSRSYCQGCGRPPLVCLCAALVTVIPRTKVVVLQHPREDGKAIGTAWMVERCLAARRIVGVELEDDPDFLAALGDPAAPAVLLAPGPSAVDLRISPPTGPVTLIVVDGTWSQASKLVRVNPSLQRLPRYSFVPATASNYRIRREPAEHCVSTIEATVAALSILEAQVGADPEELSKVLAVFDAMVEHQLRIAKERAESRHLRAAIARHAHKLGADLQAGTVLVDGPTGPRPRRLPLHRRDLVITHAEANAWPRGTEHGAFPELVHVVAERLASGERFEAFVTPERPLSPTFSAHTGIDAGRVLGGEPRPAFRARFAAFLKQDDVVGGWGHYSLDLLSREGFAFPRRVDLRSAAIRFLGRPAGDARQMAAALGGTLEPGWAEGRTGARHAAAMCVARLLSR